MLKSLGFWSVIFLLIVAGLLLATKYFVQPINTDLSVVGQGQPVLVLAYENYSPESGAALNQLNRIKKDYPSIVFAIADLGTAEGERFAQRHNLFNGAAVFLDGDGKPLKAAVLSSDEQALRKLLDEKLELVGGGR